MKTVETKLFSYAELSESAQERVRQQIAEFISSDSDNPTLDECLDSLRSIVSAMGLSLADWSVGPYSRSNHAGVNIPWDRETQLDGGARTLASFLLVLPDHGYTRPAHFAEMKFPGICGFTGVCFDNDIAESIWESLLAGESFNTAIDGAADRIAKICESDLDYRMSDGSILEYPDQDEEIYTEEGETF